ncbi:MAG: hypothetical protein V4649_08485 [Bacteroidota bacterium]
MSNREIEELREEVEIQLYSGVPNKINTHEKSKWAKFLATILPWLDEKRQIADRFLLAKVRQQEAQTLNILADANLKFEKAKRIAIEAKEKEKDLLHDEGLGYSKQEIEKQMEKIQKLIEKNSAIWGLRIEIKKNENPNSDV